LISTEKQEYLDGSVNFTQKKYAVNCPLDFFVGRSRYRGEKPLRPLIVLKCNLTPHFEGWSTMNKWLQTPWHHQSMQYSSLIIKHICNTFD